MKGRSIVVGLIVLAVLASVGVRAWISSVNETPGAAATATRAEQTNVLPQAASDPTPSGSPSPPPAPSQRELQANSAPPTTPHPADPAANAPPASASDQQLDSRIGTGDVPGDPQAQPEDASEQFMHSRRGDGQHSE